jgi:hypothetical protein
MPYHDHASTLEFLVIASKNYGRIDSLLIIDARPRAPRSAFLLLQFAIRNPKFPSHFFSKPFFIRKDSSRLLNSLGFSIIKK